MCNSVSIRFAVLDDVKGIVDVYCSSIDRWVKRVNGREVEVRYEDLSVAERWAHGGPWMSVETCAIHLNYLLTWNQYPLVALIDNRVVGELELYIGYEEGLLGTHSFIDVLEVHRDFRRRGIGRRLVEKAIEISRERECETIAVWPDPEAVDFYKKCGISDIAFRVKHVKLDLSSAKGLDPESIRIEKFPESYDSLRSCTFIAPRIETSFVAWIKSRWDYAVEKGSIEYFEASLPELGVALILESLWLNRGEANLYLWVKYVDSLPQAVEVAIGIAKRRGFNALRLLISEDVYRRYIAKYRQRYSMTI